MAIKDNSINSGWRVLKFSDCIIQLNTGLNPRDNFSLGSGSLKYITAKNLTEYGTIDFSKCDLINEQAKQIINKRSNIRIGDILLSSRAPIGHCHLIKEEPDFFDIGESIFSIRVNPEIVMPEYLCFYLASNFFVKLASKQITGSIIQEIRIGDLMNTEVIVPPIDVQENISKCLSKIDRKIAVNNAINDNLDEQLQLIFEQWFLRFEFPDERCHAYKSSGGKMNWSPQLKAFVPNGWKVQTLKNTYQIERGVSYTSDSIKTGTGTPMLNLACVDTHRNYRDGELKYYSLPVPESKLINGGDLLIACTDLTRNADIVGSPIIVPEDGVEYTFSMDMAKLEVDPHIFDKNFLYVALRQNYYHKYIKKFASGTNVLHLDLAGLDTYTMCIPPLKIQREYGEIVQKYQLEKSKLLVENRNLSSLREWLLPMLMNGQATISD
jgi:type I restriction enzyme S subunit